MTAPAKPRAKKGKGPAVPVAEEALPPIAPAPEGGWPVEEIPLAQLRLDRRLQNRAWENYDVRMQYLDALIDGVELPPVEVVRDDKGINWVWDGFHRLKAAEGADREAFKARVRPGDFRLALRLSLAANAAHGLRRSNSDKEQAVERALEDPEWSKLSTRALGEMCGVSHEYVARLRRAKEQAKKPAAPSPESPPPIVRPVLPDEMQQALAEHKIELQPWDQDSLAKHPAERQREIVERISRDELGSVFQAVEAIKRDEKLTEFRDTLAEFTPGGSRWAVVDDLDEIEAELYFAWIDFRQDLKPDVPGTGEGYQQPAAQALHYCEAISNVVMTIQVADLPGALAVDEDALISRVTNAKEDGFRGLILLARNESGDKPLEKFPAPLATLLDLSTEGDLVLLCGHGNEQFALDLLKEGRCVVFWHPDEETRERIREKLAAKSAGGKP